MTVFRWKGSVSVGGITFTPSELWNLFKDVYAEFNAAVPTDPIDRNPRFEPHNYLQELEKRKTRIQTASERVRYDEYPQLMYARTTFTTEEETKMIEGLDLSKDFFNLIPCDDNITSEIFPTLHWLDILRDVSNFYYHKPVEKIKKDLLKKLNEAKHKSSKLLTVLLDSKKQESIINVIKSSSIECTVDLDPSLDYMQNKIPLPQVSFESKWENYIDKDKVEKMKLKMQEKLLACVEEASQEHQKYTQVKDIDSAVWYVSLHTHLLHIIPTNLYVSDYGAIVDFQMGFVDVLFPQSSASKGDVNNFLNGLQFAPPSDKRQHVQGLLERNWQYSGAHPSISCTKYYVDWLVKRATSAAFQDKHRFMVTLFNQHVGTIDLKGLVNPENEAPYKLCFLIHQLMMGNLRLYSHSEIHKHRSQDDPSQAVGVNRDGPRYCIIAEHAKNCDSIAAAKLMRSFLLCSSVDEEVFESCKDWCCVLFTTWIISESIRFPASFPLTVMVLDLIEAGELTFEECCLHREADEQWQAASVEEKQNVQLNDMSGSTVFYQDLDGFHPMCCRGSTEVDIDKTIDQSIIIQKSANVLAWWVGKFLPEISGNSDESSKDPVTQGCTELTQDESIKNTVTDTLKKAFARRLMSTKFYPDALAQL